MNKNNKYDITKHLEKDTVNFKPQLRTFIRKSARDGDWVYKDLNTWYKIEELFVESWKEAGGKFEDYKAGYSPKGDEKVYEKWRKLTGLDEWIVDGNKGGKRGFGCFFMSAQQAIRELGGKLYKERKNNEDQDRSGTHCDRCQQDIEKNYQDLGKWGNLNEYYVTNDRTGKKYTLCPKCYLCSYCKKMPFQTMTNEENDKWKVDVWLCRDCSENATPRSEHRKAEGKRIPNNKICSSCQQYPLYKSSVESWEKQKLKDLNAIEEASSCKHEPYGIAFFNENGEQIATASRENTTKLSPCSVCNEIALKENSWGDKWLAEGHEINEHNEIVHLKNSKKNKPSKKVEFLNQLEQWFIQNNIKSIRVKNEQLIIKFNERDKIQTRQMDDDEKRGFNDYLQQTNRQELTLEDIRVERERERESKIQSVELLELSVAVY